MPPAAVLMLFPAMMTTLAVDNPLEPRTGSIFVPEGKAVQATFTPEGGVILDVVDAPAAEETGVSRPANCLLDVVTTFGWIRDAYLGGANSASLGQCGYERHPHHIVRMTLSTGASRAVLRVDDLATTSTFELRCNSPGTVVKDVSTFIGSPNCGYLWYGRSPFSYEAWDGHIYTEGLGFAYGEVTR